MEVAPSAAPLLLFRRSIVSRWNTFLFIEVGGGGQEVIKPPIYPLYKNITPLTTFYHGALGVWTRGDSIQTDMDNLPAETLAYMIRFLELSDALNMRLVSRGANVIVNGSSHDWAIALDTRNPPAGLANARFKGRAYFHNLAPGALPHALACTANA
jgi:hypothetical protein